MTIVGALVFGPVRGSLYSSVGATIGATAAFLVGRYAARGMVEDLIRKNAALRKIDDGVEQQGWRMLMITRLVPVFPFNAQNYVYGLTRISLPTYIVVSFICMLPGCIAFNFMAGSVRTGEFGKALIYLAAGAIVFVVLSLIPGWIKKKLRHRPMKTAVSVIIPTLDERRHLPATLAALQQPRRDGHEVIVVDGGSTDGTCDIASGHADRILSSPKGRALQMNAGAREARGEVLLFLHADTRIPHESFQAFLEGFPSSRRAWGRFDVRLSGSRRMLRVVETMMNVRSRLSGIATGDHGIFVRRETFEKIGGYPEIPLMEDVAISRRLKRESRPFRPRGRIVTSSRRWEENGILRTILLMWRLRLAYALGADPGDLARSYHS